MNQDLRSQILAQRKALAPELGARLSLQVTERFLESSSLLPKQWNGVQVAFYRALAQELDLRPLEAKLIALGARLCYPRVLDLHSRTMDFAAGRPEDEGKGADPSGLTPSWVRGAFGIEEPPAHHPRVELSQIDLIFVPGVAFGLQGERIGMGAGFYDRLLPGAPQAIKVALAFDFQLLDKLHQEPWDQRVDWIWTEKRQVRLRDWPATH